MRRVAIAAVLAFACVAVAGAETDKLTAPPDGIVPAHVTLRQVLDGHRRALGLKDPASIVETWSYAADQLSGTQVDYRSGDDYREDTALGPFATSEGSTRGRRWSRNANGLTVALTDLHRRDEVTDRAFVRPAERNSGVTLLGEVLQPMAAYVVRAAPKDGRLEYRFYDAASYLLVRTESIVEDRRVVTTYDDFRTYNGRRRPWHIHESDGKPYNEYDWKLQSLQYDVAIDPAKFSPPASEELVRAPSAKWSVPAKIVDDRVIVSAEMGGRKVNFQLDSGASTVLLNRSVADALKFASYGKTTQTTAGSYTATRTLVPELHVGEAVLRNVAVTSAPFEEWEDPKTPVAGLLGFDFISGIVLHIDYEHETVEALAPSGFTPPQGALVLPVRLDDRVPVISVRLGDTVAEHFVLDTGADRSMIFSAFADAHPELRDQGLGEQYEEAAPFFNRISGVGGEVKISHLQVPELKIGSVAFTKFLFSVSHNAAAFEGEDFDGLIGQDVLRNFDLYLDYSHLRVYLVPNRRYHDRWG